MQAVKAIDGASIELAVDGVIFRKDLYPRLEFVPELVQTYAEVLELLPPIEINQDNILIDGWHRWTAHKKKGIATIRAFVTHTKDDLHLLETAVMRNATHGMQLKMSEKRELARQIYEQTPAQDQGTKKKALADLFAVTERVVQLWTSRIDKDNREARDAAVFSLWLACHIEQWIADKVGMDQSTVHRLLCENESFRFCIKPGLFSEIEDEAERWQEIERQNRADAGHESDFKMPHYNIWKQQEKSAGSKHFGNSEVRWLDNLLYLYTQPFDVVVDPFAGGGSTIDICKKRFRRYWVSDRKPIIERGDVIRCHDMTTGLPPLPRWQDVRLIYLDPPYWKQAEGQYSNDPEDLGNMPLKQFTDTLARIIADFAKKLKPGAVIALLMQPTQWNAPDHAYTDHIADVLRAVKLPLDMRYSVPYESQQCNAQMVEWAKENRRCLVLTREIVVWKVA